MCPGRIASVIENSRFPSVSVMGERSGLPWWTGLFAGNKITATAWRVGVPILVSVCVTQVQCWEASMLAYT